MQQPPHQPCRKAGDRTTSKFSNTYMPSNSRQLARHGGLRRSGQGAASQSGGDELAHVPALMLRHGCETRNGSAIRSDDMGRVSDDETVRMARNGEILFNCY